MNIFSVMSEEELEGLPDDPEAAFVAFARRAQGVFGEEFERLTSFQDAYDQIRRERRSFMNIVVAVAKRYGINELSEFEVRVSRDNEEYQFEEFETALDHYIAQMAVGQAIHRKKDGVHLSPEAKDKIRRHIKDLKKLLDEATLSPRRKAGLMAKLEQFEKELEKRRLPWAAIGLFTLEVMALPSDLVGSGELAQRLVLKIMHELQVAKIDEEERTPTLPPIENDGYVLSPPRAPEPTPREQSRRKASPSFEPPGMDDDIPF